MAMFSQVGRKRTRKRNGGFNNAIDFLKLDDRLVKYTNLIGQLLTAQLQSKKNKNKANLDLLGES